MNLLSIFLFMNLLKKILWEASGVNNLHLSDMLLFSFSIFLATCPYIKSLLFLME